MFLDSLKINDARLLQTAENYGNIIGTVQNKLNDLPEGQEKLVTVALPVGLWAMCRAAARQAETPVKFWVARALSERIERRKEKGARA